MNALTVCSFIAILPWLGNASAIAQTTTPAASFQNATLTGSGSSITASWVPVTTGSGTIYVNLILQFDVDASGNLTVSSGFPQQGLAPTALVSTFAPGTYRGPSTVNNGQNIITVSGPGITVGGATIWSLSAASGASSVTYPASALWYTGPVAGTPIAARLAKAGVTSPFYSYGTLGGGGYAPNNWPINGLIGVSQVGNTITIVSFTNQNGDQSQPVDQITYNLQLTKTTGN